MQRLRHGLLVAGLAAVVAAVLSWAYRPATIAVELATAVQGDFAATVEEDGRTRVHDRYLVSAPVAGRLLRVRARAGDEVAADAVLATIRPALPALLDPRARQELEERVGAAEATVAEAAARVERAEAQQRQADTETRRVRALRERGVASVQQLEREELALRVADREDRAAEQRRHAADHDLAQLRALLQRYEDPASSEQIAVTAPVGGRVLRVIQESEAVVAAGAPLLEIADTSDLEIVADMLTTDAVRIVPGARVAIERWGGPDSLEGRVRLVEPGGFTKLSALGVEEQRVWVVIDITSPRARWTALGDGYRVDVRITLESFVDATVVPAGALFRSGQGWSAFVVEGGLARRRDVGVRSRSGALAAIATGIAPGERVVVFPPSAIADGVRVRER